MEVLFSLSQADFLPLKTQGEVMVPHYHFVKNEVVLKSWSALFLQSIELKPRQLQGTAYIAPTETKKGIVQ